MFNELSIITVNWNLKEDTLDFIKSLIDGGADLSQIIVVDNGSTDGSYQALKKQYQDALNIIEGDKNRGYAAGLNMGIAAALGQNSQWFLLINNDTIVAPNFVNEIQQACVGRNGYSILAPMILYHEHPNIIWSMGDRCIAHSLLTTHPYANQQDRLSFPAYLPVDFTSGCAMLVHREVFEKIGLFDETLFMYGEEVDFCWRARQAGFNSAVYPSARMWHKVSRSSSKDQPAARYYKIRNQIFFYRRYSRSLSKWLYFAYTLIRAVVISSLEFVMFRSDLSRATMRGWADGWAQKPGRSGSR